MTEDEELAMALAMSVEGNEPAAAPSTAPSAPGEASKSVRDEPFAAGHVDAAPMLGVSKEENTFAAANGAAHVGLQSCDMRAVTLRGCLMIKKEGKTCTAAVVPAQVGLASCDMRAVT